jgi:hypothetical protein
MVLLKLHAKFKGAKSRREIEDEYFEMPVVKGWMEGGWHKGSTVEELLTVVMDKD